MRPLINIMDIKLSQQIPATYARNNFKKVIKKVMEDGMCIIIRKSKPVTVILSMAEYEKIKNTKEAAQEQARIKPRKKITAKELENGKFSKYVGAWKNPFPGLTSVQIAKKWTNYVD